MTGSTHKPWWGSFDIPENQWCSWQISLFSFFVRRAENEWHFAWQRGEDPLDRRSQLALPSPSPPDLNAAEQSRHVLTGTDNRLNLGVSLADRPVIARPEVPLFVPAGEHVVLYVSTGLWCTPRLGEHVAGELPIHRPSDTWFGPDTRNGELCYASLTRARTREEQPPFYPHRAVTPVDVINQGPAPLPIERIRVPVTLLSLYARDNGQLLTDSITLKRRESDDQAILEIGSRARDHDASLTRLAEPRALSEPGTIVEAFTRLFG